MKSSTASTTGDSSAYSIDSDVNSDGSRLPDDISADSATAVVASLGAVETAATAVYATLTDCD